MLELSAKVDGGEISGAGYAAPHLKNAVANPASLGGKRMIIFRENLLGNIGPTMDAFAVAYHFVGETLEREEKVIEYTRKAVADAVDGARDTFSKIANQGFDKGMLEFTVNIFKMAFMGVTIFAPVEGVLVDLVKDIGFNLLDEAVSDSEQGEERHPGNFNTAMRDFEALMNRVNEEFAGAENRINDALKESLDLVGKRIDRFRIELKALHTKDVDNKDLENRIKEVEIKREEAYHIAQKIFQSLPTA